MTQQTSTPIGYATFPKVAVVRLDEPFMAEVQFGTLGFRGANWHTTKRFNDERHLDNWIAYMCRKYKGQMWFDEVWLIKNV